MAYIEKEPLCAWLENMNVSDFIIRKIKSEAHFPTADVVEVETIKSWLYEMAINNVGYVIDGDFSTACEEIISRLDGLRNFARERSDTE